jgi:hypothetical protein
MICEKCKKPDCDCALFDKLNVHPPCSTCNFNRPVFGDTCCEYPAPHHAANCPFVTENERARLDEWLREGKEKFGPLLWDIDLASGICDAIREFDTGNAKKGRDIIIVDR